MPMPAPAANPATSANMGQTKSGTLSSYALFKVQQTTNQSRLPSCDATSVCVSECSFELCSPNNTLLNLVRQEAVNKNVKRKTLSDNQPFTFYALRFTSSVVNIHLRADVGPLVEPLRVVDIEVDAAMRH